MDESPFDLPHLLSSQPVNIAQPKQLADRVEVARNFVRLYGMEGMPLFVDDPDSRAVRRRLEAAVHDDGDAEEISQPPLEEFEHHFAPWPLRFYILANGHVVSS